MKKNIKTTLIALLALLPLGMQAQQSVVTKDLYEGTQILNSDFEDFHVISEKYVEPNSWHSFESASGNLASLAGHHLVKKEEKRTNGRGSNVCAVYSTKLLGVIANGTVTTGRMNAGSMSAGDASGNYAYIIADATDANGNPILDVNGDPFCSKLIQRPQELAVWIKFKQKEPNTEFPYASISAVITNGKEYHDPENNVDYSKVVVGKAKNERISQTGDTWTKLVIPFDYDGYQGGTPEAILVTITTNATPGKGSANDSVLIDDLELIYTHEVEIPASGYATFTNTVMKNHKVVMPEGLKGYALAVNAGGEPYITNTFEAGDVLPYNATLLLEGKAGNYTFSTTLYDEAKAVPVAGDEGLVPASELNNPLDDYKYFYLTGEGTTLAFRKADTGLKIQDDKALLRVLTDKAADSYSYVLKTPTQKGDVNDDSDVTIADIAELVNRLLGQKPVKFIVPSGDINDDGRQSIADVTKLVNVLLNK